MAGGESGDALHPMTQVLEELLQREGCWYTTFDHAEVRTSEEAAATRPGYTLHQGAKALIMRCKFRGGTTGFAMLVINADLGCDNRKAKQLLDAKDMRFATEAEVAELTNGILPGGVPPFGNLFGLPVLAHTGLPPLERIVFNCGDRRKSIAMATSDYLRLVAPRLVDLAREPAAAGSDTAAAAL
jgi:prolyl-tRNA editing enzyme YbaK/EbsC (Cys-tRNA(Pro) deacylase)